MIKRLIYRSKKITDLSNQTNYYRLYVRSKLDWNPQAITMLTSVFFCFHTLLCCELRSFSFLNLSCKCSVIINNLNLVLKFVDDKTEIHINWWHFYHLPYCEYHFSYSDLKILGKDIVLYHVNKCYLLNIYNVFVHKSSATASPNIDHGNIKNMT